MITIIMPTKNNKKQLKAAVQAILNNTEFPYELFIIDGNSTDGSGKYVDNLVDKYEHIRCAHIPPKGISHAFNYAMEHSKGDVYLTHDDVIVPNLYGRDWLQGLYEASKVKDMGLVTTIRAGGISGPDYLNGFKWTGSWSMYIPKKTMDKIGGLDPHMRCGDDIDYCYRIYKAGLNIGVVNYWVDHHRFGHHVEDSPKWSKLAKEMGNYFKEKHGLK